MQCKTQSKHSYRFIRKLCLALAATLFLAGMSVTTYAASGDLDTSFGNGGRLPAPGGLPTLTGAFDVAVQPDGRILVAGTEQNFPAQTPTEQVGLLLTRYLPNGSLDLTFGKGGKVLTHLSATCNSYGEDLLLQTDAKIIVTVRLDGCGVDTGAYVLRYLQDGTLDTTFDEDGKLRIVSGLGLGFNTTTCRSAVQSDGKLILSCGEWMWEEDYAKVILRLKPDGSIDTTFGGGTGRVYLDANDFFPYDIAIQPDDKIVVATEVNLTGGRSVVVGRLNANGSTDVSFGTSGWVFTSGGAFDLDVRAIALQPDNKIVVVGSYQAPPNTVGGHAVRYLPNGSLDTAFGSSGIIFSSPGKYYSSVSIQSNGKIVVGDSDYRVTRFLPSGAFDSIFGVNGQTLVSFPNPTNAFYSNGSISGIAIQNDGRIITAGYWQGNGTLPEVTLEYRYQAIARLIGDSKTSSDFDGDGKADVSVFRPSTNEWHIMQSSGGMKVQPWGLSGDNIVPADYDGDGKTDLAVRRPSDNTFYIFNSSNSTMEVRNFGITGDIALPSDYNGDGKADVAVWRPSNGTWYLSLSGSGIFYVMPWGLAADKPVPGDYDGDGKTDLAVFRPTEGRWYIFNTVTGAFSTNDFGVNGDTPVQADYSGDGKTDFAVYRPSNNTWYRQHTNDGTFNVSNWGLPGDFPTPGDFDGDGKTDVAVWRPSNGTWYVLKSTSGVFTQSFGTSGDTPTPNAFVY